MLLSIAHAEGDARGQPYTIDSTSRLPEIKSSPAIASDGTLYVTALYDSGSDGGGVYSFTETANGLHLRPGWPHRFSQTIEASPTIGTDGTVFIGVDDGFVYALDKDSGALKGTSFDANKLSPTGLTLIESTAALSPDGQTLYIGVEFVDSNLRPVSGGLLALTTSLSKRWLVPTGGIVSSSPAVAPDGTIYVAGWDGKLYSVSPGGSLNWSRDIGGPQPIDASPAIGRDGTVYIGSLGEFDAITPDNRLKWQRADIGSRATAAVAADDTVYVANFLGSFSLVALRGSTGDVRWQYLGSADPKTSSPVIRADGTVLFAGFDNRVRAFDAGGTLHGKDPGTILWEAATSNQSPFDGSPTISPLDNSIWIGTRDGHMFGINGDYAVSQYASWPMFQHDAAHTGRAPTTAGGGRLVNLSSRAVAGPDVSFIAGLYAVGPAPGKTVLMRAVGPTLGLFGVANVMADPALSLHITPALAPLTNDNWQQGEAPDYTASVTAAVGAFPLPNGSKDAAIVQQVVPQIAGAKYTMLVESPHGDKGVALAEFYDADPVTQPARLVNLSTRAPVGTNDNVLIAGFVVRGGSLPLLIRGVGPGLTQFGVTDTIERPVVKVQDRSGTVLASNEGWGNSPAPATAIVASPRDIQFLSKAVGAFPLAENSADSVVIVFAQPDQLYTITVSGAAGTTGNGMVEIYDLSFQ
jgi:outer membrane protein assembly factor BamB